MAKPIKNLPILFGEDERTVSLDCGDADLNDFAMNEPLPYRKGIAGSYQYI